MTRTFPRFSPRSRIPRAFTLMEMVTSCMILSVLMLSLGYGLKLALVSTGIGASQAMGSLDAAELVDRVTDDLNEATDFTEKATQSVTFTVPDRDDNGAEEKIRYIWWPSGGTHSVASGGGGGGLIGGLLGALSGGGSTTYTIPANTLTRQLNDGIPAVLARDVRAFSLNYLYRSMSPPVSSASSERLLLQNDPGLLLGTQKDFNIDFSKWVAVSFLPSTFLPVGTTSWSISRVGLYISSDAAVESVVRVSVRGVNTANNAPNGVIYDSVLVPEVGLNKDYGWVYLTFTALNNLSPTTKYAILIEGMTGGGTYSRLNYVQSTAGIPSIPSNTWFAQTGNRGSAWAVPTNTALRYRIYGDSKP